MRRANIVLVGFMGTGKSAIGRKLARRLQRRFVDMDAELERQEGQPIAALFETRGEAHFRLLEKALVRDLAGRHGLVIAAGGGVVLDPENVGLLGRSGLIVCLTADADEIVRRVLRTSHRPLLEAPDKEARVRELLAERQPHYAAIPHQVDTTTAPSDEIVTTILTMYEAFAAAGGPGGQTPAS